MVGLGRVAVTVTMYRILHTAASQRPPRKTGRVHDHATHEGLQRLPYPGRSRCPNVGTAAKATPTGREHSQIIQEILL